MSAQIIDGKATAQNIQRQIAQQIAVLAPQAARAPGLAVILIGENPASQVYVRNKERASQKVGMVSFPHHLPATIAQTAVEHLIVSLNQDPNVDGILLQLPVPPHLDSTYLLNLIDPDKDADGLHPVNLGRLVRSEVGLRSCTPAGVMRLLTDLPLTLPGKQALVIGRSILVGKPMALMLMEQDCTVTLAHSRTVDLAHHCQQADIVVAAVGRPHLITGSMLKPGAVVIDVGMNRLPDGTLVGDVDFASAATLASWITPVPGGVGPMTVTLLLANTLKSFCSRLGLSFNPI